MRLGRGGRIPSRGRAACSTIAAAVRVTFTIFPVLSPRSDTPDRHAYPPPATGQTAPTRPPDDLGTDRRPRRGSPAAGGTVGRAGDHVARSVLRTGLDALVVATLREVRRHAEGGRRARRRRCRRDRPVLGQASPGDRLVSPPRVGCVLPDGTARRGGASCGSGAGHRPRVERNGSFARRSRPRRRARVVAMDGRAGAGMAWG